MCTPRSSDRGIHIRPRPVALLVKIYQNPDPFSEMGVETGSAGQRTVVNGTFASPGSSVLDESGNFPRRFVQERLCFRFVAVFAMTKRQGIQHHPIFLFKRWI